jgi:hypothetical protein
MKIKKLGVIAPGRWWNPNDIQQPAIGVLENPERWPATDYYLVQQKIASRFLRPENNAAAHEVWAEVSTDIKPLEDRDKQKVRRMLILDRPDKDRQLGEMIRTARMLAFDMGMLCDSEGVDVFSMRTTKISKLQTFFFPLERVPKVHMAVKKAELMGCTPIYVRLLPKSEISRSQVGVPLYWRKNGRNVDVSELQGKVALVVSQNANLPIKDDEICVSIPLAVSPLASQELSSLSINNAATLAMTAVVGLDKEYGQYKPKVLEPDEEDVQVVTERLVKRMEDGSDDTRNRQRLRERKIKAWRNFQEKWMDEEIRLGLRQRPENYWALKDPSRK